MDLNVINFPAKIISHQSTVFIDIPIYIILFISTYFKHSVTHLFVFININLTLSISVRLIQLSTHLFKYI